MLSAYYLSCFPNRPRIPLFVNLSGRYNMTRILKDKRYIGLRNASGDDYDKEAVVYWRPRVAGQTLNLRITWQGVRLRVLRLVTYARADTKPLCGHLCVFVPLHHLCSHLRDSSAGSIR